MCGVVGILGTEPVAPQILGALKRLEYRGYDSAGIATLESGHIMRRRAEGKLVNLEEKLARQPLSGHSGIGHTRWATHGAPTEQNAHPHATDRLALVHNGIIENFRELKEELEAEGAVFVTQTDTEVIAHLITTYLNEGMEPAQAVETSLHRLTGNFAIVVLFEGDDDLMIGARRGSPLAVGYGKGEMYFGSDAIALAPFTDTLAYLEDGDMAVATRAGVTFLDKEGLPVSRPITRSVVSKLLVDKGNYRHFMEKEIHEQPEMVGHTLDYYLDVARGEVLPLVDFPVDLTRVRRISIVACGTAFYAGLVGKYWIESIAKVPVTIDVASEFRYREQPFAEDELTIVVSQSGETADTLASLRYARTAGQKVVAVLNTLESSIGREADYVLPILAGVEIGVASTKAFTCMLAVFATLAVRIAKARGLLSKQKEGEYVRALAGVPALMSKALNLESQVERLARRFKSAKDVLYLGRGTSYALALEGALKLKEISYIHAEGYAAGELKHGPIALVDENLPVVVIAPHDHLFDKTVSNMQEVAARGGRLVLMSDSPLKEMGNSMLDTLILPACPAFVTPFVYAIPLQLLAYHTALELGTDVDQPRNLAKSVTVE